MTDIETQAKQLLAKAGVDAVPVPVERVAEYLGIKVDMSDLGDDCSGVLVRDGDRAVIGVNWAHHANRQRFTIAHEIGHFVLHEGETYVDKGFSVNFRDLESGSGKKREEVQANAFAAALLMPAELVRSAFKTHRFDLADDGDDLRLLAEKFGVSAQAMAIRLKDVL